VEGRFPFLDHRVIEFAARIPPQFKIYGLDEKYILKKAMTGILPPSVYNRTKRPYRAPIRRSFFGKNSPDYVRELLSPEAIRASGYFHPQAVSRLAEKARGPVGLGERDEMALAGILSTQLLHRQFVQDFPGRRIPSVHPLKLCLGPPYASLPQAQASQVTG
jgi:asparagine synthase (glutamine-hydrolysing)